MTPQRLIDELETLTFAARWQHMLALGRLARTDAQSQALIAALDASGQFYPRQLALMAAHGSGDRRLLAAGLTGKSQVLAGMAVHAAVRHLDDDELAAAIRALPRRRRKHVVAASARAGRRAAVTAAFDCFDAQEQARFLGCTTPEFCAARIAGEGGDSLSAQDWRAVAVRHPEVAHRELSGRIAAGRLSDPLARLLPSILRGFRPHVADLAVDLLGKAGALPNFHISVWEEHFVLELGTRYPREIADYYLARPAQAIPNLPPRMLAGLDAERRQRLYRLKISRISNARFRRAPPAIRAEIYASEPWERERTREGLLPLDFVALLPQAERHAEGWRGWGAKQLEAYPIRRLPYLAFLPFEEALKEAEPYLRQPDGDLRALANRAIVACGRYEPARLSEILDHALARRNEQDPVRSVMLAALAALPPSRWADAHLPSIAKLIEAALAAADASRLTFGACLTWLMRLGLRPDPPLAFIAAHFRPLLEKQGGLHGVTGIENLTGRRVVRALTPTFAAVAEVWRGRSEHWLICGLAQQLGAGVEAAPELLDIVESLTADPRRQVAEAAVNCLSAQRDRRRFVALAPKLFAEDPSWALCNPVRDHIDCRRQDLLAGLLRPRFYEGRFASHHTAVLPSFSAFRSWTARQQAAYAASLANIARDTGRSAWTQRDLVTTLSQMPAVDVAALASFARADAPDKAMRDMALRALGAVDAARGAPELIAALGGERARIAVYALRAIVLDLPPAEALRLIAGFPLNPVTVGKEAIRLAGELGTAEACEWLAALAARDDLHADLRLALLRAYWSYLDRPESWDAFDAAARSDRLALARAVVAIPDARLGAEARRRLAANQALLLANRHALVRLETLQRIAAETDRAAESLLRPALLDALQAWAPELTRLALAALIRLGAPADVVAARVALADPFVLQAAVDELQRQCALPQAGAAAVAAALAHTLTRQGRRMGAALRLVLCAMPAAELQGWIETNAARLHADGLADALAALCSASGARGEALIAAEPGLARSSEPWARRLGLALVEAQGAAKGWTRVLRARLTAYDADASPWIAEARERIALPDDSAISERGTA